MSIPKVFVLHENAAWTGPLELELKQLGVPYELWFLDEGSLDLGAAPPAGIFYSRMSASSHTRNHRYAAEYTGAVLSWLESYGRRVLNGSRALALEVSKAAQYTALRASGITTPHTVAAVGREAVIDAASHFKGSFITKDNRGGKGLGVRKFDDRAQLQSYLTGTDYEPPVDGITLVQDYILAPQPFITRCEFVGAKFLYAVRVDTSSGFELCPADVCVPDDAFCPTQAAPAPQFQIIEDFSSPLVKQYERFLARNEISVAGIEFIVDAAGQDFTYDINTNTNYNPGAEAIAGRSGMAAIARYLGATLRDEFNTNAPLRVAS